MIHTEQPDLSGDDHEGSEESARLKHRRDHDVSPERLSSERRRILYVSNIVTMSGAEHILVEHLRHTSEAVHVLAPDGPLIRKLHEHDIPLTRSRFLSELDRGGHRLWPVMGLARWLAATVEITRVGRHWRPHVLVANNFAAGIYVAAAARLLKRPWIWFIYDVFAEKTLELKILRRLAPLASAVVPASYAVRDHLESAGVTRSRLEVIYSGVDTAVRFRPQPGSDSQLRRALDIGEDVPLVAFIGHLSPHKGPQLLVEVAPELYNRFGAHTLLIGTVPPKKKGFEKTLRDRVRALGAGGYVHLTGQLDPAVVLNDIAVVVVPSLFPDPLPTVVLEAMSMARIVVAAEVGGVPEMISHGLNGYLFPEGDVTRLRSVLVSVLAEPDPAIGRNARFRVQKDFDLAQKLVFFRRLVDEVLDTGRR